MANAQAWKLLRRHDAERMRCRRERDCNICSEPIPFGHHMVLFAKRGVAVHWQCFKRASRKPQTV